MIFLINTITHIVTKYISYAKYNIDPNAKDAKFKIRDHVRISKYRSIFLKGCGPNCPEEVFEISKIKNTSPYTCVFTDLNGEQIVGTFYEKELQ